MYLGYFDQQEQQSQDLKEQLNLQMAAKASIGAGDVVLDVGYGKAGSGLWLSGSFRQAQVEGIVFTPKHRKTAPGVTMKQLSQQEERGTGNAWHIDYPDKHFSVIWACESVCHAPDRVDFYREAFRLLQPGGRLVIADGIRTERPCTMEDAHLLQQWLKGGPALDTWEDHHQNMINAGFSRLHMEDITTCVASSLEKLAALSKRMLPLDSFLKLLKLRSDLRHRSLTNVIQRYEAFQKGWWTYGLLFAIKPK